jgi:hypothetical protein
MRSAQALASSGNSIADAENRTFVLILDSKKAADMAASFRG